MSVYESYSPYERTDEMWRMDSGGQFSLTFSTLFKFQVPVLTENGTIITDMEKMSMEFGTLVEKIETNRQYNVTYELSNCTSGTLTEYGSTTELKIPFELEIRYNYGEAVEMTGVYWKRSFVKGDVRFEQTSNDTCV